jgi:hypothetical protein
MTGGVVGAYEWRRSRQLYEWRSSWKNMKRRSKAKIYTFCPYKGDIFRFKNE